MPKTIFFLSLVILSHFSFSQTKTFSVFLIGDAGEPELNGTDSVLTALRSQLIKAGRNSAIVFLGDNIYPKGLANTEDPDRTRAEAKLVAQLKVVQNYEGRPFMIPGNHDWQKGGKNGWQFIKNEGAFVADFLQSEEVFYPKDGCPTPKEISLNDSLTLVLFDSQWFLHRWDKPGETSDCEVKSLEGMLTAIDDILYNNKNKKVIVAGHHPMYSHGSHGGYFTLKDHLLPMHDLGINIPLPIVGSLYPLYRSLIGNIQDIPNPQYQEMRNGLVKIMKQYNNVIYVNGHEHSLQWLINDSINYVSSGSGSGHTPVKYGADTKYAKSTKGFARLDFYENRETSLSFFEGDAQEGKLLYSHPLSFIKNKAEKTDTVTINSFTKTKVASARYKASAFHSWLLGSNYRDVWTTPYQVKTLNLKEEDGGLKVIQRGGGLQTLSLRYKSANGGMFVTRSIEKFPISAVPEAIRSEFTIGIVDDQISASHPYAALVVPTLAEAAGVLHTNPRLVVIPEDTILGEYKRLFSNQLALFEERPDEGFAGAKKTYSTLKMIDKLAKDNHNSVDQQEVLRARLLDMLIGDWDRHDDQWRWLSYEKNGKGLVFKPLPRDRDQAFFVNKGLLPKIASRKWILPKIQGFDYKYRSIEDFNFNARYFDRSFLTGLSKKDWLAMAEEIKIKVTDAVIDLAVTHFPQPDNHAQVIAAKLKSIRNDLPKYAEQQYNFLAKGVDVVASDKDEIIEVKRLENGETDVTVFDQKDGEKGRILYQRIFDPSITKEIRIWGLDGDDRFLVNGDAKRGIKLRLVGGKGKDEFTDRSKIRGIRGILKTTFVYDKKKNTTINKGAETRNLTSDKDPDINTYNREAFKYNLLAPLAEFAYNPDNGLFLGGGLQWTIQGFRKDPYAFQHNLSGSYAFSTNAFNLFYKGSFVDLIGKTDVDVKITLQQEGITNNFFGLGNETVFDKSKGISYYRALFSNYENSITFKNNVGKTLFYYGPVYSGINVTENQSRFINQYAPIGSDLYKQKDFLGARAGFTIDTRDDKIMTTRGVYWDLNATYLHGINVLTKDDYTNVKSNLAFYYTFKLPAMVTFSTRFGGGINFTDFEFFQANYLSGLTNLRGFRQNRFAGKSAFYNNTEIRLKLLTFKSYLFPGTLGILAFNDVGRVWYPNENSVKWHDGYGGGVWLSPFKMLVVSAMYGFSDEGGFPAVRMGFFF